MDLAFSRLASRESIIFARWILPRNTINITQCILRQDRDNKPLYTLQKQNCTLRTPTPMGFEPMRAKPIGFRVQLLNHSDTVSTYSTLYAIELDGYFSPWVFAAKSVTAVGFEPTPFRTSALSWRLRPLGHAVSELVYKRSLNKRQNGLKTTRMTDWTHWDLNPGPSACEADVIPLHHEPHNRRQINTDAPF